MTTVTTDPSGGAYGPGEPSVTVSVVICAYTGDRWQLLLEAVRSVEEQTHRPLEIVLSIDHNADLYRRCLAHWSSRRPTDIPLRVIQNRYDGRLGSARNTAAEVVSGDVIAFLDDDAAASPDWLERLTEGYEDPSVMAIGGRPVPDFAADRPEWFPDDFHWVFGCAYTGLPERREPIRHLIGANMSVRRAALVAIGGFHSDNHDDMDLSHRIAHGYGGSALLYDPSAVVRHHVPISRTTWSYFWRRCYLVNRGKIRAFNGMGESANLSAEVEFVCRSMVRNGQGIPKALRSRDLNPVLRFVATLCGILLAALGNADGRARWALGQKAPEITRGMDVSRIGASHREQEDPSTRNLKELNLYAEH